jgi:hypothetical protein
MSNIPTILINNGLFISFHKFMRVRGHKAPLKTIKRTVYQLLKDFTKI